MPNLTGFKKLLGLLYLESKITAYCASPKKQTYDKTA